MTPPTGTSIVLFVAVVGVLYGVVWLLDRRSTRAEAHSRRPRRGGVTRPAVGGRG